MGSPRSLTKKQIIEILSRGESLSDIDIRGIDLSGTNFDNADLTYAKLAECNLSRATFRNANLTNASLWHAECKDAIFDGANLEEADLDYSNLDGCSFRNAKIRKAIFPFSKLPLEEIQASVKTGKKVRMDRGRLDDE